MWRYLNPITPLIQDRLSLAKEDESCVWLLLHFLWCLKNCTLNLLLCSLGFVYHVPWWLGNWFHCEKLSLLFSVILCYVFKSYKAWHFILNTEITVCWTHGRMCLWEHCPSVFPALSAEGIHLPLTPTLHSAKPGDVRRDSLHALRIKGQNVRQNMSNYLFVSPLQYEEEVSVHLQFVS